MLWLPRILRRQRSVKIARRPSKHNIFHGREPNPPVRLPQPRRKYKAAPLPKRTRSSVSHLIPGALPVSRPGSFNKTKSSLRVQDTMDLDDATNGLPTSFNQPTQELEDIAEDAGGKIHVNGELEQAIRASRQTQRRAQMSADRRRREATQRDQALFREMEQERKAKAEKRYEEVRAGLRLEEERWKTAVTGQNNAVLDLFRWQEAARLIQESGTIRGLDDLRYKMDVAQMYMSRYNADQSASKARTVHLLAELPDPEKKEAGERMELLYYRFQEAEVLRIKNEKERIANEERSRFELGRTWRKQEADRAAALEEQRMREMMEREMARKRLEESLRKEKEAQAFFREQERQAREQEWIRMQQEQLRQQMEERERLKEEQRMREEQERLNQMHAARIREAAEERVREEQRLRQMHAVRQAAKECAREAKSRRRAEEERRRQERQRQAEEERRRQERQRQAEEKLRRERQRQAEEELRRERQRQAEEELRRERERQAEEERRRQERQRQADEERRRQEAAQQQPEAPQHLGPEEYVHVYEAKWNVLKNPSVSIPPIPLGEIPWPVFPRENLSAVTAELVEEFVFHPLRLQLMGKTRKECIRMEMLRWHPDKFNARVLGRVAEHDREGVRFVATEITKILTVLNQQVQREGRA
ncbi:hypothetical protein DENSPDRAFT_282897 [Dentipellis sp. KUC8613]|nr:hypothetical protein DENSPDRAFT_282897 [Dentipellis sp. KUC8613]